MVTCKIIKSILLVIFLVSDNSRNRCLVFGDFNLVLGQAEKNGDTIQQCGLTDLGYIGHILS